MSSQEQNVEPKALDQQALDKKDLIARTEARMKAKHAIDAALLELKLEVKTLCESLTLTETVLASEHWQAAIDIIRTTVARGEDLKKAADKLTGLIK